MKIAVVGTGYVGLSNAVLLAQSNQVVAFDINEEKIDLINNKVSPIDDIDLQEYLSHENLNLFATKNKIDAYLEADYVIIATPTDYNPDTNMFDTSSVDNVINEILEINSKITIVIRSTLPIGYTRQKQIEKNKENIVFFPEFLREGKALHDNLFPSRIIAGGNKKYCAEIARLLSEGAKKESIQVLYTNSTEAEAIKLFSNTYLALRVAFFNELDTYAEISGLNSKDIVEGIGLDKRIGNHYNNPSFGYGGYCLPKDTKQLLSNYINIPQNIITAIVDSNNTRKNHIADMIILKKPKIVGIYRLIMKSNSDNFRQSAILDIIKKVKDKGVEVIIYEPLLSSTNFFGSKVINYLDTFKEVCDLIVTNRYFKELADVKHKVYTRDLFNKD